MLYFFALSSHTHVHLTLQSLGYGVSQATENKDFYKCAEREDKNIQNK
jgi:hypothetical protein